MSLELSQKVTFARVSEFFSNNSKTKWFYKFWRNFFRKNSLREYFRVRVGNYFTESFNALPAANFTRLDALIWISLPV